jgi:putative transposase
MARAIVRTDKWKLNPDDESREWMSNTVNEYRAFCKALSFVVLNRWAEISQSPSRCAAIEQLIHQTSKNGNPYHSYFGRRFYKFPSYLRRAAIEFVCGQVSSYLTRYRAWQGGERKHRSAKPPVFNPDFGCYPSLYKGQCIKFAKSLDEVAIKVWNGSDWVWSEIKVASKRTRHLEGQLLSPALIVKGNKIHLSVPFRIKPPSCEGSTVCAVDVGINTLATIAIVGPDGTVTARKFIHPAADIDHRNKIGLRIRRKARLTKKLHKGFCKSLYRKAQNLNKNIAHQTSREIVNFAIDNGADTIVFENLKGWKPKGGRKRSGLKQRFHGWLHRCLFDFTSMKFEEIGGSTVEVYARGTSSWAFDGSGKLKRSKRNYALATFQTGKQYNCDLSAAQNIGARFWAWKLKLTRRKDGRLLSGKSSGSKSRMPITLSHLWDWEAAHVRVAS